jgi:hypothetical protein
MFICDPWQGPGKLSWAMTLASEKNRGVRPVINRAAGYWEAI